MWVAFSDPDEKIRRSAAHVLKWVLIFIAARPEVRNELYTKILDEIVKNLVQEKPDARLHGTLLALSALIENVHGFLVRISLNQCLMLQVVRFDEVTDAVLHLKDHKALPVKRCVDIVWELIVISAVMSIIPKLAKISPVRFSEKHLRPLAEYLLTNMNKERSTCLVAVGELTTVLRSKLLYSLFTGFGRQSVAFSIHNIRLCCTSIICFGVLETVTARFTGCLSVRYLRSRISRWRCRKSNPHYRLYVWAHVIYNNILAHLSELHFSESLLKMLTVVVKKIHVPVLRKRIDAYLLRTAKQMLMTPSQVYDARAKVMRMLRVVNSLEITCRARRTDSFGA